jgi:Lrp/AsnC family transcriptional regulator for asnA, asnC and gidA
LNSLDFEILSCLQEDGRMSFTVIAEKLQVSIGTVRTRFNKMIDDGTINIIGRVNPDKVGFRCYAHIAVFVRPATLKEKVATKISKLPEVSFLAMTSGDYDLEVDVMCRDNNHLVDFVNVISKIDRVNQTKTTIYFKV